MKLCIQTTIHRLVIPSLVLFALPVCRAQDFKAPPGHYHTSWVGNSFGGGGGPNGFGDRVQNGADEIGVTPDGTVVAGTDWDEAGRCVLNDVRDLVIAPDQSLWVISGTKVLHMGKDGREVSPAIASVGKPTAVALDNQGRLIVCDDGPDQQVKFFDASPEPKQVAMFGDRGGLLAGKPGLVSPHKLFALRGAGTDKDGNLYVAMGFGGAGGQPRSAIFHAGRRVALGTDEPGVRRYV